MGRVVAKYEGDGNRDKALAIITDHGFKIKEFVGPLREPEHSHFELIVDERGAYIAGHDKNRKKFVVILQGEPNITPSRDTEVTDARSLW